MNNKFDALKDDDSGDHDQNEENSTQKDGEKEKMERDKSQSSSKRKAVVPGPAEHPLQYNYTFWYSRRTPGRPTSSQSYEQNIKQIGTFASVEQFWRFYSHMVRPGDLTGHSDFHLFKEGIKPMWEGYERAWPPVAGRISSWPCWGSSSWLGRRSVGPWSPSGFRRTLFPYGIRLPATKPPPPESGIRFGECLTYLPTPLWNTKPTPTASRTIQAFEIQKSHCESTQAGNNPFLYVCVCPKWMGGLQLVLPSAH
uniref:Eukaryotic translation initiation factor 4E family member 2 n=1 Tax=Rousettus aegyptiacus TaxID=9407 RepID=A0A7J8JDZ6_ROUAE|nr:eukaryotic translation initiation factor 4E family member 2 [Rousettus aegyptiacus]